MNNYIGGDIVNIVVVGSLNMDAVISLDRYPTSGETVTASSIQYIPGGKGANQAVAAARLGAAVTHIGMVGNDDHGRTLVQALKQDRIDTAYVQMWEGPTGTAFVHVEQDGANRIILAPGANAAFSPEVLQPLQDVISRADAVLVQLEIPMETVRLTLQYARTANVPVYLDPAPARLDFFDYINEVDWMTPNESEAEMLTGEPVHDVEGAKRAATRLQQMGAKGVIIKAGENGAYVFDEHRMIHQPGFSVEAVDTTAAGDAFNAGFVIEFLRSRDVHRAMRFGCAVGALTTTKPGAQTSIPNQTDVTAFLIRHDAV